MILFSGEQDFVYERGREITFKGSVSYSKRWDEISFEGEFFELEYENGDPVLVRVDLCIDGNELAGYLNLELE